jgi:hypothetical protein
MTTFLSLLAAKATPYIIGAGAILAAFAGAYLKGRYAGKRTAETAQMAKEAQARDIGHQVDNDIGAMTPAQAREALQKWSKP